MRKIFAVIIGVLIISIGFLTVFLYHYNQKPLTILLFFDIDNKQNLPQWCDDLEYSLKKQNIHATIFVTGKIAEEYPSCINNLVKQNDVGSLTYDYFNLTEGDYATQLDEIKHGKDVIDEIGHVDSKLFKAPYGNTDDDTYDALNQSEIIADFSHNTQYYKFYNGAFLKFDDIAYDGALHTADFFQNLSTYEPVIVDFNNTIPVTNIDQFISQLKTGNILLQNASQLVGTDLTVQKEQSP